MKRGFSLIEIVFSIVIIGLAFTAIPAIIGILNENTKNMLASSSFYHAFAKAKMITNKPFDENNIKDFETSNIYYILDTDENNFDCNIDGFRVGQYEGQYKRMCYPNQIAGMIGKEGSEFNDIDDFDGLNEVVSNFEYRYKIDYVPTQFNDGNYTPTLASSPNTTNTKRIKIEIKNGPTFYVYAFNIGVSRPYVKDQ